MAEKEFDPDDPMALTGAVMALSGPEAESAEREMAATFVEEFALLGYGDDALLALFKDPFYGFPHRVYRARGEAWVRELINVVREGATRPWEGRDG